ncbi:hypothetical protein FNV43_RR22663 [Rhamnella rubrinervis]|uniref:Serine carboxypeptidase n=1 Tax=Rhamnella rubrinervis TaxID=2594499 RepID=A0A8K0DX17_9ROSA|nr:hypothetical protein FNV43_RR22663 [Rhamnella rubrinervis]
MGLYYYYTYLGVGDLEDYQLFYYFVKSERNSENDPLMLWLTGGPLSFNYENSSRDSVTLQLNPYSWTKRLLTHAKSLANPLYIGGDSYSGKIVPIVVQKVSNGIEVGSEPTMNLKGYILGNPVTTDKKDLNYRIEYAHRLTLLSDRIYQWTKRNCNGDYIDVDPDNQLCLNDLKVVDECIGKVSLEHVLLPNCPGSDAYEGNVIGFHVGKKQTCKLDKRAYSNIWMNYAEVQKALRIREGTKTSWVRCNRTIPYTKDVLSTLPYHRNLTHKFLRALIYSGDHDMTIPYLSTHAWIKSLDLGIEDDWRPWFSDDDQVAGYTMRYTNKKYHLTFATVKGGGHTAPEFNPKECFNMIDRWLAYSIL